MCVRVSIQLCVSIHIVSLLVHACKRTQCTVELASLKGHVPDLIPRPRHTVEPLYKGQVPDLIPRPRHTVEPLYKGQVPDLIPRPRHTVEPLYKGQVGDGSFVPWREVVLFSEVTSVLWKFQPVRSFLQQLSSFQSVHYQRFHCIASYCT